MRAAFCAMLLSVAALLVPEGVFAQAFPAKPIRLVIPFPVGGSSDANARIIIPALTERWKQPIIVEPRPGAGTVVGTDYVAKTAPDGHTLLLTSNQYGYTPAVYAKLPYDPYNDIVPITIVTISPQAIVVHPSLPVRNARELIALARSRPGQLDMGTAGSVLPVHFFNMLAKTSIQVVPYKGAAPLMTDAMGGHIPLALAAISSVQGAVRSGRVKILAVCSSTRSVLFPDAPLIGNDLPGYDVNAWFGLMAPKGVSPEYVHRVRDDVAAVIEMPDVRQRLLDIGGEPSGITPEEFSARVRKEIAMWKKVAAEVGLKPE